MIGQLRHKPQPSSTIVSFNAYFETTVLPFCFMATGNFAAASVKKYGLIRKKCNNERNQK
jgi:hypothetical protein